MRLGNFACWGFAVDVEFLGEFWDAELLFFRGVGEGMQWA